MLLFDINTAMWPSWIKLLASNLAERAAPRHMVEVSNAYTMVYHYGCDLGDRAIVTEGGAEGSRLDGVLFEIVRLGLARVRGMF